MAEPTVGFPKLALKGKGKMTPPPGYHWDAEKKDWVKNEPQLEEVKTIPPTVEGDVPSAH